MDSYAVEREKKYLAELKQLHLLMRFPFDCTHLMHAHRACVAKNADWRPCDAIRVRLAVQLPAG